MRRWLMFMSLLVAGLLMVGWAGDALAARHSPSLLQRILSALTPRPAPHHYVGANKSAETRKAELPPVQPVSTAPPVPPPRPIGLQPGAAAPDPIARIIETAPPAPKAQPDPASSLLQTTQASKGAKAPKPAQVEPVRAVPAIDGPLLARPEPPVETQPASEPVPKPARTAQTAKKAKPAKATPPIMPTRFEVAQVDGKTVPAAPPLEMAQPVFAVQSKPASKPVETTQTIAAGPVKPTQPRQAAQPAQGAQPMQVAILGAPNLKAALPAENAAPIEAPADEPRVPAARPEPKSACNGGRRVVSAYYWEGHHTASGQPFNPRGMPFGTRLNVTNPRTGKTVNVLINDRGPFVRGVSLDLSLGAAQAIGLQGTGSVCIL